MAIGDYADMLEQSVVNRIQSTILNGTDETLAKYLTDSRYFDFVPGDYVKCTILQGFYQIVDMEISYIRIKNIQSGSEFSLSPKFLKKLDKETKALKVLYENRSRRLHSR